MTESAFSPNAPIILTAAMGKADHRRFTALRDEHFPPDRNYLNAHITLFHHLPGSMEASIIGEVKRALAEYPAPRATIDRLIPLGRGVAYHVDSPELLSIREELAERFHGMLTPQDEGRPRLHVTIQNKVEPREAKALLAELSADFEPREIDIIGIAAHFYRGGPWDDIGCWRFRGRGG